MNKIKVLYDVVKTMKKKEMINGVINLQVAKGEINLVSFSNEFERNNVSGCTKAKINKEINMDGKKIKQQTEVEVDTKDCPFHKFHHHMHEHGQEHPGFKTKLSKAAFVLNILNNLEAQSKEDKTVLSLDLKEVIKEGKELRAEFQKNFSEGQPNKEDAGSAEEMMRGPKHHAFMKKFLCEEYKDAVLNVTINKNNEVEKVEISANGENTINGSLSINY